MARVKTSLPPERKSGAEWRADSWLTRQFDNEVRGATDGRQVRCPRCGEMRPHGVCCERCERVGVEAI